MISISQNRTNVKIKIQINVKSLHQFNTILKLLINPGLTRAAVVWLGKAYLEQTPVNKQAFDETFNRLSQINKPCHC